MSNKNDDEIKLIIAGEDEYSGASEGVRDELSDLSKQAGKTRDELTKLDKSLELADTYQRQEQELNGLVSAQAKAQIAVRELNEANRASKGANEEVTESLVRAKAELSSLRTSTTKAQKAIDQTKASMKQYGVDLNDVQANQKRYREESDRLATELTHLSLVQTKLVAKARQQASVQIELSAEQFEASEKAVRQELSLSSAQVIKADSH
ncbi:hypothetical protein [Neptunomonas phycophila]|uniref:hypothetical protein n=1 Tax=Neptunomonas phycophila TaxID=1572645 RepID=UPI0030F9B5B7